MGAAQYRAMVAPMIGKAASHDQLLSSPKYNGMTHLAPPIDRHRYYNGYFAMSLSEDEFRDVPVYATGPRSMSMRITNPRKDAGHSNSTLDPESGFSSKASSSLNTNHSCSSTPSSPRAVLRRKPPPKPPRMQSSIVDHRIASTDTLLSRTPTPSLRSADVNTLKSSLVDVTNALDCTLSRSFHEHPVTSSPMLKRYNTTGENHAKVYNILAQTKEILAFELEPEPILRHLADKKIISKITEDEIRRTRNKHTRCEYLIDVITAKGQDEFIAFCDALRNIGQQSYLADFLQVLDSLVEIATSNKLKPVPNAKTSSTVAFDGGQQCFSCSCNNNVDDSDIIGDSASFEIDISYVNRDTAETRSVRDVAKMKRRRRPLSITSEDFTLLEEADKYIPMISVSLYYQCLMGSGIKTIANILEHYPCVRELSLVKNHIDTAESMSLLATALEKNRSLANLDIRLNHIGDDGSVHLADSLSRHSSLRTLNVNSTGLCGVGCSRLVKGISRSPSLVELNMGFNEMTEQSCEALCRCLAGNNTLRRLRMRCNNITPYGARCVFKGLKRNSRVHYIDISRNRIKDESIQMLSEVLLLNRTLKGINLENCCLTAESCVALARALKTNTSLKSLDLSMNSIGDAGAQAISEGLKYNQALDTLCLNMCNIGNKGFLHILDALRFNTSMKILKLCYNKIGKNPRYSDIWLNLRNMPEVCLSENAIYANVSSTPASSPTGTSLTPSSGRLTLSTSPSSPVSLTRGPVAPLSPVTPLSPLTATLRHNFSHSLAVGVDPMELMYETLCEVLQQNKDLKVLLWGNNFDDGQDTDSDGLSLN